MYISAILFCNCRRQSASRGAEVRSAATAEDNNIITGSLLENRGQSYFFQLYVKKEIQGKRSCNFCKKTTVQLYSLQVKVRQKKEFAVFMRNSSVSHSSFFCVHAFFGLFLQAVFGQCFLLRGLNSNQNYYRVK